MKKTLYRICVMLVVCIGLWMVGTGFRKEPSAFVDDYSLSEDGSVLTIHAGVGSSMGFIRKAAVSQRADGALRLTFLSAFGGWNGSIGAKTTYEILLDQNVSSVFLYQGDHDRLILKKDAGSGAWAPVGWTPRSAI